MLINWIYDKLWEIKQNFNELSNPAGKWSSSTVLINLFQFYSPQPEDLVTPNIGNQQEATRRERGEEQVGGKQTAFKLASTCY